MENTQNTDIPTPIHKKHLGFIWPLISLFVIAVVVAGVVIWLSNESILNDEVSSMVIKIHKSSPKTPMKQSIELKK